MEKKHKLGVEIETSRMEQKCLATRP